MFDDKDDLCKVRIAKAFSSLSVGYAIFDARDEDSVILVIRKIGERLVLASFSPCDCGCGIKRLIKIFPSTYHWSEKDEALTDSDDKIPFWWSVQDLSVSKDLHNNFQELLAGYNSVPVFDDFIEDFKNGFNEDSFLLKYENLINNLTDFIRVSSSKAIALLHIFNKTKDFPNYEKLIIFQILLSVLEEKNEENGVFSFRSFLNTFYAVNDQDKRKNKLVH